MVTYLQLWRNKQVRKKEFRRTRTVALKFSPQKRGIINKIVIIKPKKPNSAKRHVAKLTLSYGKRISAAIPGEYPTSKDRTLKQYSKILIRGGRCRDIIGLHYKIILGKIDAQPLYHRKTSRSKYGVKKMHLS